MRGDANRKPPLDAAESKTLRMRGNSLHGNRETLETPSPQDERRYGKALCRTTDAHVSRESDDSIVPEKRANNAGRTMLRTVPPAAESVEGRGSTKGNATRTLLAPDAVPGKRGNANRLPNACGPNCKRSNSSYGDGCTAR
ncbi:MAG: hypothetical protein ACWGMZ_07730 [Thermoguttaceae bacterium]